MKLGELVWYCDEGDTAITLIHDSGSHDRVDFWEGSLFDLPDDYDDLAVKGFCPSEHGELMVRVVHPVLAEWSRTIDSYRDQWGADICTPITVDRGVAHFTFDPDSASGYEMLIDLYTGQTSHKGFGQGCFWTDWE